MEAPSNIDVTEILSFLEKQKDETDYQNVEEAVLFLGRTGTGKSTLTHFLVDGSDITCEGKEGQFVMVDTKGHISDPSTTILSQTIFPAPLQYEDTLYYMDCPGFRDTRSFSMEIVSTIFTKKALEFCHGVKLIFVMSYEEVKQGGDRNAFIDLVENAADFVRELEKFESSIGLFVTKVPNLTKIVNNERVLVSDRSMKEHVRDFFKSTLKTIQEMRHIPRAKRNVFKKAEEFIEIMLQDNEDMSRVGIFRTPEKVGPIDRIEVFKEAKNMLNGIIHDVLEFTDVCPDDFGFTISSGSKLCITKAIEDCVQTASSIISDLCKHAIQCWQDFEEEEKDFQKLVEHFRSEVKAWRTTFDELQNTEITSDALDCIIQHMDKVLDKDVESDKRKQLANHAELIDLMQTVSNDKYRISIAKWTKAFRLAFDEVNASKDWYERLPILIIIFKYTTQQKSPKLIREFMTKLSKWIEEDDPVSGDDFRNALSLTAKEFSVVQIGYDISIVKLKHLYDLCKAGKLDTVQEEKGFLGFLKRVVGTVAIAGTNAFLKLLSGKSPFEGEIFDEVRKICYEEK